MPSLLWRGKAERPTESIKVIAMSEILKENIKISTELAMMKEVDRKKLVDKGASFFNHAAIEGKLDDRQKDSVHAAFLAEILHHFGNGRSGKTFEFKKLEHAKDFEKAGLTSEQISAISIMARRHLKDIHRFGVSVAKKWAKKK